MYDRVIANPPFSLDEWGREVAESDGYGRFRFGVPPRTKGDYVDTSEEEERIDVAEAVRKLRALERERAAAEAAMNRYLAELGYDG